ncbi:hypothetical protein L211DRAFT_646594 [Terfezia boudieri ATCC MYA-4762]|uniref:Uncharacterized protein n=1 Tax=Terfezia boudieri ATCC MYA-4762 TaxID=1051890 RepID=A0A3N4MAM7_9PEZI|nr:hypothetical protein L211DRAFT_646594 [Terfezia boudieri ATCC MYA-4762]
MASSNQAANECTESVSSTEVVPTQSSIVATPILSGESTTASTPAATTKKRVRFTDEEKLKLIRLCVLHQKDHRHGNKKTFWMKIRDLLQEETGKELRDPQQTVDALVIQYQNQVKKEEKESGM